MAKCICPNIKMTLMTILREISRLTTKGKISEEDSRDASSALWGHQEGEEVGLLGRKGGPEMEWGGRDDWSPSLQKGRPPASATT